MKSQKIFSANVMISALGYFVDIYDLVIFSIVRVPSLRGIGVQEEQLLEKGVFLINVQMLGLLIGGLIWGVLGDKRGRVSVLFGSIFLYSIANIANAFVTSVEAYAVLRFIAGIGLAGELGAAITLVSETLPRHLRGYGTTIVASIGICGAVVAGLIGDLFSWQVAYMVGGGLGLLLLALRVSMFESGLFKDCKEKSVSRGDLRLLISPFPRFLKYLRCILIGVPIWFVVGVLVTFSPELGKALGIQGDVSAGYGIMFCYAGLAVGDLASGLLSQYLKSRKKSILLFLLLTTAFILVYANAHQWSLENFYALCAALGFATGYWAMFITVAAEQFGTNIRATVTTTVPNFVRGAVVLLTLAFKGLTPHFGLLTSAIGVGLVTMLIAFLSLWKMPETFHAELDYLEHK